MVTEGREKRQELSQIGGQKGARMMTCIMVEYWILALRKIICGKTREILVKPIV